MNNNSVIFAVIVVLLVPFLYTASSLPDACAAPKEQGWGTSTCKITDDEKYKICCWHEPDGDMVCQICAPDGTNCEPPTVHNKGSKDLLPGRVPDVGVLQGPSSDSGPKLPQKDGMVLSTENNTAHPQQNSSTNNNTLSREYAKEPGKIEFPNIK